MAQHPINESDIIHDDDPQVQIGDSRAILTGQISADNTAPESPPAGAVPVILQDAATRLENNTTNQGTGPFRPDDAFRPINKFDLDTEVESSKAQALSPQDWRVKIGLLPGSDAFYKSGDPGILSPLIKTDGVIFPYTPNIQLTYQAEYQTTTPTHSNYPSRFYSSSEIRDVQINGTFTAQSTHEADYMMAAIHFFRSCTKMFYGQDDNKGMPPPLVQMTGLGPHQFNGHKAVINYFNYTLPENVDYVRTSDAYGQSGSTTVNQKRAKLENNGDQYGIFGIATRIGRLLGIGANPGALRPGINQSSQTSDLARAGSSYVPTKMEFSLTLLPVVSRKEQSLAYSTGQYANGNNYKGRGHW